MTREEEITNAALEDCAEQILDCKWAFMHGAKWADQHPRMLYIVLRSEEHADYVEEVFVDEEKAKSYCGLFNGNEDAYYRYITKINITL